MEPKPGTYTHGVNGLRLSPRPVHEPETMPDPHRTPLHGETNPRPDVRVPESNFNAFDEALRVSTLMFSEPTEKIDNGDGTYTYVWTADGRETRARSMPISRPLDLDFDFDPHIAALGEIRMSRYPQAPLPPYDNREKYDDPQRRLAEYSRLYGDLSRRYDDQRAAGVTVASALSALPRSIGAVIVSSARIGFYMLREGVRLTIEAAQDMASGLDAAAERDAKAVRRRIGLPSVETRRQRIDRLIRDVDDGELMP